MLKAIRNSINRKRAFETAMVTHREMVANMRKDIPARPYILKGK